ncbi:S-layer homology domain-containing protein [Anaerobacillus sp. HL2]|nr:S-layer homology domain-containing protein [Anaerobacillus sp. HL2]
MAAVDAGILVGNSDGTFGGSEPITRERAATMIVRAITLTQAQVELNSTKSLNDFKDKAKVSPWAASSVEKLVQAGIISGRADAHVAPKGKLTACKKFLQC